MVSFSARDAANACVHVGRVAKHAGVIAHAVLDILPDRLDGQRTVGFEDVEQTSDRLVDQAALGGAFGTGVLRRAAACSAQRVPRTWPALSAAPPGRVTPCVPAASPTA